MRAFVFTDKALERYAGRFVWLAVDTENSVNTGFLAKYPISVWPTLLVIDPKKEAVALRYAGGATVPQLEKLLDDGERAVRGKEGAADQELARADRLATSGKNAEAAKAYDEAIRQAPKGWKRLGRASEGLTLALMMARESEPCAERAAALYPKLKGTLSGANTAANGLGCANDLPADAKDRAKLIATLEKAVRESLDNRKIDMAADDRSGLYETLIDSRAAAKDEAEAHALREEWAAYLEGEAEKAKTPEQRAVFDPHRLTAYLQLNQPEKAIPMLEQSQRDLPNDYNPPARLAVAYKAMGRFDDALAASDRALKLVYGPRKIGVYRTRADIYAAKGDKEAAKQTIREAIAYAESLPEQQRSTQTIAALKKKLDTL
jgi:hypothetical protein